MTVAEAIDQVNAAATHGSVDGHTILATDGENDFRVERVLEGFSVRVHLYMNSSPVFYNVDAKHSVKEAWRRLDEKVRTLADERRATSYRSALDFFSN